MKKLLPLLCIAVLFFSCKTTGAAAELEDQIAAEIENAIEEVEEDSAQENSVEDNSAEENSIEESPVEENSIAEDSVEEPEEEQAPLEELVIPEIPEEKAESEKIPQNELDEMTSLLQETEVRVQETGDRGQEESGNSNRQQATEVPAVSVAQSTTIAPAANPANTAPATKPAQSTTINPAQSATSATNTANTAPAQSTTSAPATQSSATNTAQTDSSIASAYDFTSDDDSETDSEEEEPTVPIVPSRKMTVKNNQFVDVVYPGTGWIYLGETGGGDHFIFQGRKLGKNETTFSLRSKKPGSTILHFYKNDALTGKYIDDYIQITVGEQGATDAAHVKAPAYAEVVPPRYDPEKSKAQKDLNAAQEEKENALAEASKKSETQQEIPQAQKPEPSTKEPPAKENAPAENVQTVIQTSGSADKNEGGKKTSVAGAPSNNAPASAKEGDKKSPPAANAQGTSALSLLEQAQKAYDEKRYAEALDLIHQFFEVATKDFDAGLYLQGLILEAKSEVQNIKAAIDAYDTLMKNWPQSRFWRRASERSIYLKRFYIDIR